jgi:hypothetical protein
VFRHARSILHRAESEEAKAAGESRAVDSAETMIAAANFARQIKKQAITGTSPSAQTAASRVLIAAA